MNLPPWIEALRSSREDRAKGYAIRPSLSGANGFSPEEIRAHLAGSSQEPNLIAALEKALEALEELKNTVVSECADGDISRFHHNPGMAARWLDYVTDPIVREISSAGAAEDSEEMK